MLRRHAAMTPGGAANETFTTCDAVISLPEGDTEERLLDLLYAFGPCFFSPPKACGSCGSRMRFKLCVDGDRVASYTKCECSESVHTPEAIGGIVSQVVGLKKTYEVLPVYFCSLRSSKDDDVVFAVWVPARNYRNHYTGKLSTPRVLTNLVGAAYSDLCSAAFMGNVPTHYFFIGDLRSCSYLYFCLENKQDVVCVGLTSRNIEFTRVYYMAREALMSVR